MSTFINEKREKNLDHKRILVWFHFIFRTQTIQWLQAPDCTVGPDAPVQVFSLLSFNNSCFEESIGLSSSNDKSFIFSCSSLTTVLSSFVSPTLARMLSNATSLLLPVAFISALTSLILSVAPLFTWAAFPFFGTLSGASSDLTVGLFFSITDSFRGGSLLTT